MNTKCRSALGMPSASSRLMAIDSAVALWEYPKIVSGSSALKAPGFAVNSFSTARTTSSAAVRLLGPC